MKMNAMKSITITVLTLITIADAAAHETPAILHSHATPFTLHSGALLLIAMGAIAAVYCVAKLRHSRGLSGIHSRTDSRTD